MFFAKGECSAVTPSHHPMVDYCTITSLTHVFYTHNINTYLGLK